MSSVKPNINKCLLCSGHASPLFRSDIDVAVTSDCHPVQGRIEIFQCENCRVIQKNPDDLYLSTLQRIYKDYRIYEVSGGHEQVKFTDGVPRARSEIILDNIDGLIPPTGDFLDVGTGSGVFLRAVSKRFGPHVALHAQDIHDNERGALLQIPCFKQFHYGDIRNIREQFDVISLIHVFEHILDPIELLQSIKERLKAQGVVIFQVPNIEQTAFDAVIYDHVFHYSRQTLLGVVGRVFRYCCIPPKQINNEITLVASDSPERFPHVQSSHASGEVNLNVVKVVTNYLRQVKEKIAVFGVSPPGTYCGAVLGDKLACFVDEDKNIQYKTHLNHVIVPPEDIKDGLKVFLPPNRNASLIRSRLSNLLFIEVEKL